MHSIEAIQMFSKILKRYQEIGKEKKEYSVIFEAVISVFDIMFADSLKRVIDDPLNIDPPTMHNCERCEYHTDQLNNWKRHLNSKKHKNPSQVEICGYCGKEYNVNGMAMHQKQCKKRYELGGVEAVKSYVGFQSGLGDKENE